MLNLIPASTVTCPVDECTWSTTNKPPALEPTALAEVFGLGVISAVARSEYHQELEARIDAHLQKHTVLEWTKTVMRLRDELAGSQK